MRERLFLPVSESDSVALRRAAQVDDETDDDKARGRDGQVSGSESRFGQDDAGSARTAQTHPVKVITLMKDAQNSSSPNTLMPSKLRPMTNAR